jgi:hypothetical protein
MRLARVAGKRVCQSVRFARGVCAFMHLCVRARVCVCVCE